MGENTPKPPEDRPPHLPISPPPVVGQKPVLNYSAPTPSRTNTPGLFFARMALGFAGGIVALGIGWAFAAATSNGWFLVIVPAVALVGAIFVAIRYRRFGYVTGVILAPIVATFVVTVTAVVMLFLICGGIYK